MRTIDATLAAAMRAGEGVLYVWISLDSTPATTREVIEYHIFNHGLQFECKCLDIGDQSMNRKIALTRGVYVGGTMYSVASPTWFLYYYETTQGITTLRGYCFRRSTYVGASDVDVDTLLTTILSAAGITADFEGTEYPVGEQFGPAGSTVNLAIMGDIISLLRRKYFMSAFGRESATIHFRSMGYGASNASGTAYTIPSDAVVTVKKSLRITIVCTWIDEVGTVHYNYTPPTSKPVHDCGYIESTVNAQKVTDSSEDKAPQFEFICRPDFTLEDGDLVEISGYDKGYLDVEEFFRSGPRPLWHQIVSDLPWRPITAAAGGQLDVLTDTVARYNLDASRFTSLLAESNQSIQSALETLDQHTH